MPEEIHVHVSAGAKVVIDVDGDENSVSVEKRSRRSSSSIADLAPKVFAYQPKPYEMPHSRLWQGPTPIHDEDILIDLHDTLGRLGDHLYDI